MPIKMNKPSESSFGINVEDRFDPADDHLVELVDMEEYNGISKIDGKPYTSITWKFAVYDADGVAFTNLIDGGVFESWQFTGLSLGVGQKGPSIARLWAAALLGKTELTDAECDKLADAFDTALVGKRAMASWKLETDKVTQNKKLKIALLRPVRRQRTAAPARPSAEELEAEVTKIAGPPVAAKNGATETAAEKRARLHAELAAMSDAEDAEDGDAPF